MNFLHPEDQTFFIASTFTRRVQNFIVGVRHHKVRDNPLEQMVQIEMDMHLHELYQRGILAVGGHSSDWRDAAKKVQVKVNHVTGEVTILLDDVFRRLGLPLMEGARGCKFIDPRLIEKEQYPDGRYVDVKD
jgi:hypothetical protein